MVQANGLTLHVEQLEPEGPTRSGTAVMLHGMGSDSLASWYLTLAAPFAEAGYRVVMYDQRGHGRSDRPPTGYGLDDFVGDLEALLAELDVAGPVHLLGNSFGGTVAFAYAVRHPERVADIVAIESEPPVGTWGERMAQKLGRAAEKLPTEQAVARIVADRGEGARRRAANAERMLATTTLATELPASRQLDPARLTALTCPVLCLYGAESHMAPQATTVAGLLPHARIVMVPEQRHRLLVNAPGEVRELVLPWLADNTHEYGLPQPAEQEILP
jgi:pimeloyl-ACP methyl ester carboxylesterase